MAQGTVVIMTHSNRNTDPVKSGYTGHIDLLPFLQQVTIMEYDTSICKEIFPFTQDLDISSSGPRNSSVLWEFEHVFDRQGPKIRKFVSCPQISYKNQKLNFKVSDPSVHYNLAVSFFFCFTKLSP